MSDSEVQVPDGWEVYNIGSLGKIITGNTPKTNEPDNYGGTIPFISPSDLGDHSSIRETKTYITIKGLKQTRELPENTVLVVCIGSTIGKTGITTCLSATNQQINSIICECHDPFFTYQLMSNISQKIKSLAGTQAVPIINKTEFSTLLVNVPPLPEQKKIATILTSVDDVIEKTEAQISKLQDLKKGMMTELLTKGIGHTEFKDSPVGRIPVSWEVGRLGDFVKFSQGVQVDVELQAREKQEGFTRFIRIVDYTQKTCDIRYIKTPNNKKGMVGKNDVVMVRYGASTGFIGNGIEGIIANNMFQIKPTGNTLKSYLYHYLKQSFIYDLISLATAGSAMPAVNFGIVSFLPFTCPNTIKEQEKIVSSIESLDNRIEIQKNKLTHTTSLKKALMNDLLTGKVRVSTTTN
jgi:type I restriction enzyme S subunit